MDKNPQLKDKINLELVRLQDELNELESAVDHINKAGKISQSLLEAIKSTQSRYEQVIKTMEEKYLSFLNTATNRTQQQVANLTESHGRQVEEVQKLLDNYLDLAEATARLPEEIGKIDFPVRLDRIEDATKNISETLLRTQSNLDELEQRLAERMGSIQNLDKKVTKNTSRMAATQTIALISLILVAVLVALQLVPGFKALLGS